MKRFGKIFKTLTAGLLATATLGAFAACGPNEEPFDPGTSAEGNYIMVDGDITYDLTIDSNTDYSMTITKDCGTYSIVKLFLGPTHYQEYVDNGVYTLAVMPVFLSDVYYEGTGAPDDVEELFTLMSIAYSANKGTTEADRECYIHANKKDGTFTVDEGKPVPIDLTGGYWTVDDLAEFATAAGTYTMVDGDITYCLTVDTNTDYSMTITKNCGTYSIVKLFLGPTHYQEYQGEGVYTMAVMPVFLSDVYYEGTGAPDDVDELFTRMAAAYAANKGTTEADRECYIHVKKIGSTFTVDEGQPVPIDLTGGYWTVEDLAAFAN